MVISPAFTLSFSSSKSSSRKISSNLSESPTSPYFLSSTTRGILNSSSNSINSWTNDFIVNNVHPSTSSTAFTHSRFVFVILL